MRWEFQSKWVRLVVEFFPQLPAIRRHRVLSPALDGAVQRRLRRQISGRLRHGEQDAA